MQSRAVRGFRSAGVVTAVLAASAALSAQAAFAGTGEGSADVDQGPGKSGPGEVGSRVVVKTSNNGQGEPMTSSVGSWEPPACWWEPKYNPKEYEEYWKEAWKGWGTGKAYVGPHYEKLQRGKFNKGKKGMWWAVAYNQNMSAQQRLDGCKLGGYEQWVPAGEPAPMADAIDPEMLSRIAYDATRLPAPPVVLKPGPDTQKVNLATYVTFKAPLDRVWSTASIDVGGVNYAATSVATPVKLRVDAGTEYADPKVCEYGLKGGKGGYQVDTKGSGCNVKYERSSRGGTYPLKAEVVWDVTWNPTADPDGAPQHNDLPDGLSAYEQDVTVKEVQTVVR